MDTILLQPGVDQPIKSLIESLDAIRIYSPILAFLLALMLFIIIILTKAYLAKDKKVDELNKAAIDSTEADVKLITELKGVLERFIEAEKSQGETRKDFQAQLQHSSMAVEKVMDKILAKIEAVYERVSILKP